MIPRLPAALLLLLALAPARAAGLPASVAQALGEAGIPAADVAVVVQDVDAAEPLLAVGEGRSLNPASVMKLVTTLAALDSLGPAHTWKTRVLATGEARAGVLDGDLILQGGGDPALTLERFWLMLRELRARGIREIRGDVLVDQAYYAIEPVDPGRFDGAPQRAYNAPPAALLVSHNTLALHLSAGPDGARAQFDPMPAGLQLANELTLDPGPCNGWRGGIVTLMEPGRLRLQGRYPAACGEQRLWVNLLSPDATLAVAFAAVWEELGGRLAGRIRPAAAPADARLLLEFDSPQLGLIVRDINTYSNNVMAKMLLLNLGAARYGGPATWEKGAEAVEAWLAEKGIDTRQLVLENGSGLSRSERLCAASLARLLRWAAASPVYYPFAASLPVLGTNGTLKPRLKDTPQAGQAWLKTGSLNGVRALAGYVLDAGGRRKVLVMLINHPNAAAATKAQDALIAWAMRPGAAQPGP